MIDWKKRQSLTSQHCDIKKTVRLGAQFSSEGAESSIYAGWSC